MSGEREYGQSVDGFDSLIERIRDEANDGLFHTGAQLSISVDGETVVDEAIGKTHLHEPYETKTLAALYCTAKPVVAVAILRLIADDELSFDDRLGDVVDDVNADWIADRTIEQVLGHTAGLHVMNTIIARILPERSRSDWIDASPPPEGWRFGSDRSYSEFAGWYLLGKAIESLAEQPFHEFIHERVLTPYGIDRSNLLFGFDEATYTKLRPRISATLDLTTDRPVPLLAEVGIETVQEWNPAFGAYGTMGAMRQFYEGLLDDLNGAHKVVPSELLETATSARLPLTFDQTLGRDAGFGLGFMTPLESHYFGAGPSSAAFGHAGQGGTSLAFADPEHNLAVAVLFNAGLDEDTALSFRRVGLVDSIYRALGVPISSRADI